MSGRAVVGVAGGPAALAALRRAVVEARRDGAELVVVRAFACLGTPPAPVLTEPVVTRLLRHRAAAAIERAFAATGGAPYDLDISRATPEDAPGPALVAIADRPDDLLIVGRDRHHLLHRALHGSISGYCVSHAACRVLVVPAPDAAPAHAPASRPHPLHALRGGLST